MSRPVFTAELFAELRRKVASHNDVSKDEGKVKLGQLKKIYERGYKGRNPAERAMAKVDAHLLALRKADPDFDESKHRRDADGKFAPKGGGASRPQRVVPVRASQSMAYADVRTRQQHQRLQRENAGYEAATTAVIPETRWQVAGAATRDFGTIGLGAATVASLASKKPRPVVQRVVEGLGGAAGYAAGGALAGSKVVAGNRLANTVRRAVGRSEKAIDQQSAKAAVKRVARMGERVGRFAGKVAIKPLRVTAQMAATGASLGARSRLSRGVRLGSVALAAGIPIGLTINRSIRGSMLDPERIGRDIDVMSYRRVRKGVMTDDMGDARDAIIAQLRKSDSPEDLKKAWPQLIGRSTTALATGLSAAAGGGAAAYAANRATGGKKGGNPYRDKHGKFTSKENAAFTVGSGIAGAAAAGLGVYAALRGRNRRILSRALESTLGRQSRINAQIRSGNTRIAGLRDKVASRADDIEARVKADKAVSSIRSEVSTYGEAAPSLIRERVRQQRNSKLAQTAHQLDSFRVPVKEDGRTVWRTVAQLRGQSASSDAAIKRLRSAIDSMDAQDFQQAVKDLKPNVRKSMLDNFNRRARDADEVAGQIEAARKAVDAARSKISKISSELTDAKAMEAAAEGANKEAAVKRVQRLLESQRRAEAELSRAQRTPITSPVTGETMERPTLADIQSRVRDAELKARERAARAVDTEIENVKARAQVALQERTNRRIAALAATRDQRRLTPAQARAASSELRRASAKVDSISRELNESLDLAGIRGARRARILAGGRGGNDNISRMVRELAAARTELNAKASAYMDAMATPGRRGLPNWLRGELTEDLTAAGRTMRRSARNFINNPKAKNFVAATRDLARKAPSEFQKKFRDAFMVRAEDGKWHLSGNKIVQRRHLFTVMKGAAGITGVGFGASELSDAAGRLYRNLKIEHQIDPISGQGFVGVSAPDPDNPRGERVLVWGERMVGEGGERTRPLYAGARMSQVRNAAQGGGPRGPGGGGVQQAAPGIDQQVNEKVRNKLNSLQAKLASAPDDDAGVSFRFRPDSENDGNAEAGEFMGAFRRATFGRDGKVSGPKEFYDGLTRVFSQQGQILKAGQMVNLFTGDAERNRPGLFSFNMKLLNSDEPTDVADAVRNALSAVPAPRDDQQRQNLMRAVKAIGIARPGFTADMRKGVYDAIRDGSLWRGGGQRTESRAEKASTPPFEGSWKVTPSSYTSGRPEGWGGNTLSSYIAPKARSISDSLGLRDADERESMGRIVDQFAQAAYKASGGALTMEQSVDAAIRALRSTYGLDSNSLSQEQRAARRREADQKVYFAELNRELLRLEREMNKLAKAELVPSGARRFDESKIRRNPKGHEGGGRFAPKGGSSAPSRYDAPAAEQDALIAASKVTRAIRPPAAGGAARAATVVAAEDVGRKSARYERAQPERPWHEPNRAFGTMGMIAAGDTAWRVAARYLPPGANTGGKVINLALKSAAAMAGSAVGQRVGEGVAGVTYRLAGKKNPGPQRDPVKEERGLTAAKAGGGIAGAIAGSTIGRVAGGAIGTAVAPGVGSVAGAAVGGYLGEVLSEPTYKHFKAYGRDYMRRVERFFE